MGAQQLLQETVAELETCVQAVAVEFEQPLLINRSGYPAFRHTSQDDLLASFLKAVRIVSGLNAALSLLREGYVHEVYALCRIVDEQCEDIWFLASPLAEDGPSRDQIRFLEEFFQEEIDDPANPLGSHQKRDRVPRRKIHAALSQIPGHTSNPSHIQKLQQTLQKTFSGYIHGAYSHIMELYGGSPPKYHTNGMKDTPRIEECARQLVNYVYRSLLAVQVVARRVGHRQIDRRLTELNILLAERTACVSNIEIERARRRLTNGTESTDESHAEP